MPGTAFLGPAFTGAKTGSVYQASLSYGTGKIMDQVKQNNGYASASDNPGIGITPNNDFIKEFKISE